MVKRIKEWVGWQVFKVCLRFNWNYTTTYKGRVWATKKTFDWRKQRIYFSGDLDFTPFSHPAPTNKPKGK